MIIIYPDLCQVVVVVDDGDDDGGGGFAEKLRFCDLSIGHTLLGFTLGTLLEYFFSLFEFLKILAVVTLIPVLMKMVVVLMMVMTILNCVSFFTCL